jgi:hypothetical protein
MSFWGSSTVVALIWSAQDVLSLGSVGGKVMEFITLLIDDREEIRERCTELIRRRRGRVGRYACLVAGGYVLASMQDDRRHWN